MNIFEGRADYGDATTVAMIEELADMLEKAEKLDTKIFKRLPAAKHNEFEALLKVDFDTRALRKYADDWQARLDADVS